MEGGDLARLWKGGKHGRLSPLMQAKAWGLSEAGVSQVAIAAKLEKIGGGHPTKAAVCNLLQRIAGDPEWYPGKRPDASRSKGVPSGAPRSLCVVPHSKDPEVLSRGSTET